MKIHDLEESALKRQLPKFDQYELSGKSKDWLITQFYRLADKTFITDYESSIILFSIARQLKHEIISPKEAIYRIHREIR